MNNESGVIQSKYEINIARNFVDYCETLIILYNEVLYAEIYSHECSDTYICLS